MSTHGVPACSTRQAGSISPQAFSRVPAFSAQTPIAIGTPSKSGCFRRKIGGETDHHRVLWHRVVDRVVSATETVAAGKVVADEGERRRTSEVQIGLFDRVGGSGGIVRVGPVEKPSHRQDDSAESDRHQAGTPAAHFTWLGLGLIDKMVGEGAFSVDERYSEVGDTGDDQPGK